MESLPDVAIILIVLGLAIALPWLLFLAADRRGRDEAGNVWQHSLDAMQKTLRGETKDLDELSEKVRKIEAESKKDKPE